MRSKLQATRFLLLFHFIQSLSLAVSLSFPPLAGNELFLLGHSVPVAVLGVGIPIGTFFLLLLLLFRRNAADQIILRALQRVCVCVLYLYTGLFTILMLRCFFMLMSYCFLSFLIYSSYLPI